MSTPTSDGLAKPSQWRALLNALLRPSMTSVLVCLTTAALIYGTVMSLSASTVCGIVEWHSQYSFDQQDEAAYVTCKALKLADLEFSEQALIFFGASTTRESFDEVALKKLLEQKGVAAEIHNLTSSGQHVLEAIALSDAIPQRFKGKVVIGLNPSRVGKKVDVKPFFQTPRMGLPSPSLRMEARYWQVREPRRPAGLYAWDNRYFIARLWSNVVPTLPGILMHKPAPKAVPRHFYLNQPSQSPADLEAHFLEVAASLGGYDQTVEANLAALERLITQLRLRGIEVVLLEAPINPDFINRLGTNVYKKHIERMNVFAKRNGVYYWNIPVELNLAAEYFFDWGHLRATVAQQAYTAALAAHIENEFGKRLP